MTITEGKFNFGMEIECYLKEHGNKVKVGAYHGGNLLPCGWLSERDGSLLRGNYQENHLAVEFVSPIINQHNGMKYIDNLMDYIVPFKPYMNENCGIHVHIGVPQDGCFNFIRNLTCLVGMFEPIFYTTGNVTKRVMSQYCYPMVLTKDTMKNMFHFPTTVLDVVWNGDHYGGFNTYHMSHGNVTKDTVEFRYYSHEADGVLRKEYPVMCLEITLRICELASKLTPKEVYNLVESVKLHNSESIFAIFDKYILNGGSGLVGTASFQDEIRKLSQDRFFNVLGKDDKLARIFNLKK